MLPASKNLNSDLLPRFVFLSGPGGTTDPPGASPSARASSTQCSQRAKADFQIYFHDLFSCLAQWNHRSTWCISISQSQLHAVLTQSKTDFHIYFHDVFVCLAPVEPQIHLVHPHRSEAAPHNASREQEPEFGFTFTIYFLPGPSGTTDLPGASPSA